MYRCKACAKKYNSSEKLRNHAKKCNRDNSSLRSSLQTRSSLRSSVEEKDYKKVCRDLLQERKSLKDQIEILDSDLRKEKNNKRDLDRYYRDILREKNSQIEVLDSSLTEESKTPRKSLENTITSLKKKLSMIESKNKKEIGKINSEKTKLISTLDSTKLYLNELEKNLSHTKSELQNLQQNTRIEREKYFSQTTKNEDVSKLIQEEKHKYNSLYQDYKNLSNQFYTKEKENAIQIKKLELQLREELEKKDRQIANLDMSYSDRINTQVRSLEDKISKLENNHKENLKQINALTLEFFDENSLNFLKDEHPKIPAFSKAAVWFEQEANAGNEEQLFDDWMDLIKANNGEEESAWFAMNEKEKKDLEEFRHEISLKVTDYLSQYKVNKLGTDMAVPDERFDEFYYFCIEEMKKNEFNYVAYGHFGNSHLHMNLLPRNEEEYEKGKNVYKDIYRKVVELGGTVSAEHGIGKIKREYLLEMYGEKVLREMAKLKKQLDPNLILGYGNIFKEEFLMSH